MNNQLTIKLVQFICCLSLGLTTASVADTKLKAFHPSSPKQIENAREGQAFIAILWSIDCPPCFKELALLQELTEQLKGELKERFSKVNVVLIATDDEQYRESVNKTLVEFQLENMDNWIFANSSPERLRYSIDPSWYGELPRAYFYDKSHQRYSHSGSLSKQQLQKWLLATQSSP